MAEMPAVEVGLLAGHKAGEEPHVRNETASWVDQLPLMASE